MSSMSQTHQAFWAKQAARSHLEHQSTQKHSGQPCPTNGTGATLAAAGTLPQASAQGHETRITYKPQELPCIWAGKAEGRRKLLTTRQTTISNK